MLISASSSRRIAALLIVLLLTLLSLTGCRARESYPDRPLILICPWAVGGGTDRVSRQVAAFLEQELGVPVNVVNATGGAGVTGHSRGARSRPDGHTIMMMTVEINMLHWRELTDISWQDFTPLAQLNRDPAALFVRIDEQRLKTAPELIEYVRNHPGTLTGSGTALGGIWHLALGGMLNSAGLSPASIKWIPTNGAGPALQELASGGVDVVACSLPEARTLMLSNKVRCLGVMADERLPGWESVPTLKEQNVNWSLGGWRGLGLPKGTPPEIVARLAAALARIVKGETVVAGNRFPDYMATEGFNLSYEDAAKFQQTLADTDAQLGALLTRPEFATVNTDRFAPMHFPKLIMAGIGLLLALISMSRRKQGSEESAENAWSSPSRNEWRLFIELILAVAVFALLAETVGFIIVSAVLLCYLLWRMGSRVWTSVLIAAATVSVVYTFFATLMRVPLPRGWFGW